MKINKQIKLEDIVSAELIDFIKEFGSKKTKIELVARTLDNESKLFLLEDDKKELYMEIIENNAGLAYEWNDGFMEARERIILD
jgi:hypothetical protein